MQAWANELDDRWILPLRDSTVTEVTWDDRVRMRLDPPGEITVGAGALLTKGPLSAPGAEPRTLAELGPAGSQHVAGSRVLSAVGFKNGALRVVFSSGWQLNVRVADAYVPATVTVGGSLTWWRSDAGSQLSASP